MRVVVIGAGIIGVSIADALARRGVEVIVLDSRPVGHGASRASAGILAPYVEAAEDSPLLPLAIRSLADYDEFVAGAASRSGRTVEYARSGTLQIALSGADVTHLRQSAEWLKRRAVACEWLDATEVRSHEPAVTKGAIGGLLIPGHAVVGVSSLVAALAQSARLSGAVFESPVDVSRIVPRRDAVEVSAGDRRLEGDDVIVAAGCWSGRLRIDGVPALPVRPVRGQLLHLQWAPGEVRAPSRVVWAPECYAVPWSDGSVLVGATMEDVGFDERTTLAGVAQLSAAVTALLPSAAQATMIEARVGLRPASSDGVPIIGSFAAAPRIWAATGHFRNGILLAPLTASLIERALVDRLVDEALTLTRLERFSG